MGKIIAFLLCMNIICSAASSLGESVPAREECVLARTLSGWLGVEVTTDGQNLRFSGEKAKLEEAAAKLRDFDQIRRVFLPVSHGAAVIRSVAKPIESWSECFAVLGIKPSLVSLFNLDGATDDSGKQLVIPASGGFNGPVAQRYVDIITENSIFFKWIVDNFGDQFIAYFETTKEDDKTTKETAETPKPTRFLRIRYGLLNQFLCLGDIAITEEQEGKHDGDDAHVGSEFVISRHAVLRSLVAAGSGSISLERRDGCEYGIRFVSLGEGAGNSYPTVEFVLDTSGSMMESIATINMTMPQLLQRLSSAFPRIKVRIFSFNDAKNLEAEFDLLQGKPTPTLRTLVASGSTNLGHIASSIALRDGEQSKAVVAFTDGNHVSSVSLTDALSGLRDVQASGRFALPRLFRVGARSSGSANFFGEMSGIFGGSAYYRGSIDDFCALLVRDINDISRPKTAVSLQRAGLVLNVNWMPDDVPGLFMAGAQVRDGDAIVHRHGSHVVSLPAAAEQIATIAPVLDAKAVKRAERERLLAALAALGDDD